MTDLSTGNSFCQPAEAIAFERGAFDYSDGNRSVDPLWDPVEQRLGTAIDWIRETLRPTVETLSGAEALRHLGVVSQYVADITLRSPDFDRVCRDAGMSRDDIQDLRTRLVKHRRTECSSRNFDLEVLVRDSTSAGSLIVNDLGYVRLTGAEDGLLVPLAADVAVFLRFGQSAFDEPSLGIGWLDPHLEEARRAMAKASPVAGGHGPRWLYSHPAEEPPNVA